ncbi:preprotein translocase subunit SecE [Jejudonia soesokkakensis]|uniref:Protein translocase subunit SecE n=1 Tax=Jejudonia soesokkakensis TaxID=1323432 RepID=A0ABW2MPW4_9FLAO
MKKFSSEKNKTPVQMVNYIKESYNELKNHVTWTPWPEAQRLTVIVAVFSVLLALAVWGVDTVFSGIIEQYFKWIKS